MRVLTVGHGTLPADQLGSLLREAGVSRVVDVRRFPGSRRHPQFARSALAQWLPALGIAYRWAEALGGRRAPNPDSPNGGLRNAAFRGYADHMASPEFSAAVARLLSEAGRSQVAVLCAESLWWRCHRRLMADHLVLVAGVAVEHLLHDGTLAAHVLTDHAERDGGTVIYPAAPRLAL
jgi:uncharacterized protein (DUF488 family)